jgi:hypothetical protein
VCGFSFPRTSSSLATSVNLQNEPNAIQETARGISIPSITVLTFPEFKMRNSTPFSQQYFQEDKEGAKENRNHYLEEAAAKENRNHPQHRYHEQTDSTSTEPLSPKLPMRDQEVATSATNNREDEDAHQLENDSSKRRTICLIAVVFALLTVTVGLLQYKHGMQEDKNENRWSDYITGTFPGSIILRSGESLLLGDFVASPSGDFRVRMSDRGDLMLEDMRSNSTIWSAGVVGGVACDMQNDGNVVIRNQLEESLWSTGTHKHDSSTLIVDDGGRIGVRYSETLVWMQGSAGAQYTGPSSNDLIFPVRGAFYYAWYPQTWKVSSGDLARFEPDLGYYLSGDPVVVESHIDQFEYGNIDLGIISWFGPGSNLDIARITQLLDKTFDRKSQLKWTVYYEDEVRLFESLLLSTMDNDEEIISLVFA